MAAPVDTCNGARPTAARSCSSLSESGLGRGLCVRSRTMATARLSALSRRAKAALTVVIASVAAPSAKAGRLTRKNR